MTPENKHYQEAIRSALHILQAIPDTTPAGGNCCETAMANPLYRAEQARKILYDAIVYDAPDLVIAPGSKMACMVIKAGSPEPLGERPTYAVHIPPPAVVWSENVQGRDYRVVVAWDMEHSQGLAPMVTVEKRADRDAMGMDRWNVADDIPARVLAYAVQELATYHAPVWELDGCKR